MSGVFGQICTSQVERAVQMFPLVKLAKLIFQLKVKVQAPSPDRVGKDTATTIIRITTVAII